MQCCFYLLAASTHYPHFHLHAYINMCLLPAGCFFEVIKGDLLVEALSKSFKHDYTSSIGAVSVVKPGLAARVEEGFACFFRVRVVLVGAQEPFGLASCYVWCHYLL